ncbi:MAG: HEAT repeat domain-containing protein [Planctomycetota bacterium]
MQDLLERLRKGDDGAWIELRGMGPKLVTALPALREALKEGDGPMRLRIIEVLETLRGEAAPAVPELALCLRTGDPAIRAAAADTLATIGAPALGALKESLQDKQPEVRRAACRALGTIGATAAGTVPALVERLVDTGEAEPVRQRAAWALGAIGTDQGVAQMAHVFSTEGGTLGLWIAEAFTSMGRAARPAADALRDELHRDDPELALAAAGALFALRRHEEQAIWGLIRLLQEKDDEVATEAALLLGEFGARATAAIPALRTAESSEDEDLRRSAKLAIAKIRPEYAQL